MDTSLNGNKDLEQITFDQFCKILTKKLKNADKHPIYSCTFRDLANSHYVDQRTFDRWRTLKSPYIIPAQENYKTLFTQLDTYCQATGKSQVEVLVDGFGLQEDYKRYEYKAFKRIVIQALHDKISYSVSNKLESYCDTKDFIKSRLDKKKKIKTISMCFFTGWDWLKDLEKRKLLDYFRENEINVRIIVNHKSAVEEIAESMTNPKEEKHYLGYTQAIDQWNTYSSDTGNLELRISDLPILRKVCFVEYEDNSCEALLHNYIYTVYTSPQQNYTLIDNNNIFFEYYKNEFEHLWEKGLTFDVWFNTYDYIAETKTLKYDEFILFHFVNKKNFEISLLQLPKSRKASLSSSLPNDIPFFENKKNGTYSHKGTYKIMENNIFITLTDSCGFDPICIQLLNPLSRSNHYYSGIFTKLNYLSSTAYKCLAIQKDYFKTLDQRQINNLISEYTKVAKTSTLTTNSKELEFLNNLN